MSFPLNLDRLTAARLPEGAPYTPESLAAYQLQKLNETLLLAKEHSRFYRAHLPDSPHLDCLKDLESLPFTSEWDLQEGLEEFLCEGPGEISRIFTLETSGSTGKPKRIGFTEDDIRLTLDFFRYGMRDVTAPGKRVMLCMPGQRENGVTHLLAKALSSFGAVPLIYGPIEDLQHAGDFLIREKPDCLAGIPGQVLALAAYMESCGLPESLRLESILLSTDDLCESMRRRIEGIFGCRVFNHYGCTEMGFGGALECPAHRGMHLREGDLYVEVVDPVTGKSVPPGQTGEVVFTTLNRKGMPLIRYQTGDFACLDQELCVCGSPLRRLSSPARQTGRAFEANGKTVPLQRLDEALFSLSWLTDYQLTVEDSPDHPPILEFTLWTLDGAEIDQQGCLAALYSLPELEGAAEQIRLLPAKPQAASPSLLGKRYIHFNAPF